MVYVNIIYELSIHTAYILKKRNIIVGAGFIRMILSYY